MAMGNVDGRGDAGLPARAAIRRHWILFMIPGVLMVILGLLAAAAPIMATLFVETFAGWMFLTGGFVGLAALFTAKDVPGFVWTLLGAVLAILIGAFLVWRPLVGVLTLTIALAGYFAAHGITQIVTAIAHRDVVVPSWPWMAVSGVADLILAAIVVAGWPGTSVWVLGLLVGISLALSGAALVMTAVTCRAVDEVVPRER